MPDQPDRAREDEEAVQAVDRESYIDKHRRHRAIHVQDQVVLLYRGNLFHFERKVQAGGLRIQTLNVPDQLLHPLVRITQTLDAMADPRHRAMVLLHVHQEFIHRHLIVDGILEVAARIGHGAAEAGTDHDQTCRYRLGHPDPGAGRDDRPQGAADAGAMIG
ncbi:MAG: hypothetical protein JW394_0768 [Nitrospira sp.]|nr:hypothetical protein [Nitrospira sp.]